jgi:hypothetical protein
MTHPAPGRLVPQDEAEYGSGKDEEPGARYHVPHPLHVQLPHLSAEKASQRHLAAAIIINNDQTKRQSPQCPLSTSLLRDTSSKIHGKNLFTVFITCPVSR